MNRREFIVGTSAGVLAATGLAEEPKIKVGVLGASHSHATEKLRILRAHPAYDFIGAAEEAPAVRAKHSGVNWVSRVDLFARAQAVVIESGVRDHARDALATLNAGKHVHLEKPPSANWDEMRELVRVARERKCLLQVGYMWRHNPGFLRIFEAVKNGWLGEVFQVRTMMNNLLAANLRDEWAEFAGGAFFEQAAHLVDAVIRLLGTPKRVTPLFQSSQGDALVDNNVVIFQFDKAQAVITNSTQQPNAFAHRNFEVYGTNGTMVLKPIEPPVLAVDLAKAAGPYVAGNQSVSLPKYARYIGEFDELAACVRGGTELSVSLDQELVIHEWLLRSCGMF